MARLMNDIRIDENEDLVFSNGDFLVEESTSIHQQQIILNNKGDFKQNPTVGVGVFEYFNDEEEKGLIRAISVEFAKDGMDVNSITIDKSGKLMTQATYK